MIIPVHEFIDLQLDFQVSKIEIIAAIVGSDLISGDSSVTLLLGAIDLLEEISAVIEMNISLLDDRPVLPPAQFAVAISVKAIIEAIKKLLLWNVAVWIVALNHHIVLLVPCCKVHDSVVGDRHTLVSGTLGVVPEPADEPVVPVISSLLVLINDTVFVTVTKGHFMVDVGLIAHIVTNNIVER